jgi:hypothetical protein
MPSRVRVFLATYRRRDLLPRALQSLRAQTMTDWVCELHNDDPADAFPGELVRELGDPRVQLVVHPRNLGGTGTFNLFFQPTAEPFYSLLEDDNWWDPEFLETMLAAAEAYPKAVVLWANMRVWQQEPGGDFRDTGRLLHPCRAGDPPRLVSWGHSTQIWGAIHSTGAVLVRSRPGDDFRTPDIPIAGVEMFRERLFPHPLVLVPRPLAHFSLTLATARSDDPAEWASLQVMLAATFLRHARYDSRRLAELWSEARAQRPPATSILLLASLLERDGRRIRRGASWGDWLLLARGAVRRPGVLWRVFASRRKQRDWWDFLERATRERFAEARTRA